MARIEIYTKDYCPYCKSAKALLERYGVAFTEYDVTHDPDKADEMIRRSGGALTVPQIFIDGRLVGGSDDLHALHGAGDLARLLDSLVDA